MTGERHLWRITSSVDHYWIGYVCQRVTVRHAFYDNRKYQNLDSLAPVSSLSAATVKMFVISTYETIKVGKRRRSFSLSEGEARKWQIPDGWHTNIGLCGGNCCTDVWLCRWMEIFVGYCLEGMKSWWEEGIVSAELRRLLQLKKRPSKTQSSTRHKFNSKRRRRISSIISILCLLSCGERILMKTGHVNGRRCFWQSQFFKVIFRHHLSKLFI